jgi:hypothetical protein
VRRLARRDDEQPVEPKLSHRGAGHRDVTGMRRVEPPAEDADARSLRHFRGR